MTTTPKLTLNELAANQSSPHVTVNASLRKLDALVHLSVEDRALNTPPSTPAEGDSYIVGAASTGLWSAFVVDTVAVFIGGSWTALMPREGWLAWVKDEAKLYLYGTGSPAAWEELVTGGVATTIVDDPAWTAPGELVIGDGVGAAVILPASPGDGWLHTDGTGAVFWDILPGGAGANFDNSFFPGVPGATAVIAAFTFLTSAEFYVQDMACQAITGPSADKDFDVQVNGVSKGTLHMDTSGYAYGTDDVAGPHSTGGGGVIKIIGPATPTTVANIAIKLQYTV